MPEMEMYRLSALVQAHDFDVKALAYANDGKSKENLLVSSSRDGQVKLWGVTEANEFSLLHSHHDHLHFVNAVAIIDPSETHPQGLVASGGADNMVRLLDVGSREVSAILSNHTNNVCCLAHYGNSRLISGSWDSTAAVWNPQTGKLLYALTGHSNAVWCALAIAEDTFITGSADKTIKIWKENKCVKTLSGHTDCVRSLQMLDPIMGTFVSAGNDGSIRFWNADGAALDTWEHAHDAYIYAVALLEGNRLASAGEDRCIKIWDLMTKSCLQSIPVPSTSIWTLQALDDGDVACGTSDGHIYVYSAEVGRQLFDEALLEVYEEKLRGAQLSRQGNEAIDNAQVKSKSSLDEPGKTPGEHMLVQNGGKVEAYQWDGLQWIKIGDVVDSKGTHVRQEFEGQLYDYVFDVNIEDGAGSLKLPFNLTDNPYSAAQSFVSHNMLPPEYVDQIVDFLLKNTEEDRKHLPSGPHNPYQQSVDKKPKEPPFVETPILLSSANLDGIRKKIIEFNAGGIDLKPIEELVAFLLKTTSKRPVGVTECFASLSEWPVDKLFPVLDLARVAVLNPKLTTDLVQFVKAHTLVVLPPASNPKIAQAITLMQLRLLVNSLALQYELAFADDGDKLQALKTLRALASAQDTSKEPNLALQALFNVSYAYGHTDIRSDDVEKYMMALLLDRLRPASQKVSDAAGKEGLKLIISSLYHIRAKIPKSHLRTVYGELETLRGSLTDAGLKASVALLLDLLSQ